MSVEDFTELLTLVAPSISKQETKLKKPIPPDQRLSVTLFYLATGHSRRSLSWSYKISHNLIAAIIPEVCKAIHDVLKEKYLKLPATSEKWQDIAKGFYNLWNFPLCLGALDGKRVPVRKTANCGSGDFETKAHDNLIMLGLVDANYQFMYVDVGEKGHSSESGVWDRCTLREDIENQSIQIPPASTLPYTNTKAPYVVVGDDVFPLKTYLMKPYSGRNITRDQAIFNYRLSRARRVADNAFGILASKFRVLLQPIASKPVFIKDIIFATVVLHNFLQMRNGKPVSPELLQREDQEKGIIISGEWEAVSMESLQPIPRGCSNEAKAVRDNFKDYFISTGAVSWQDTMANFQ
ncbi:protein ALP1-like [Penaeus monodon]|uniref:protein ALP1-like n=1 Tax=Penaeus monodon TaxID=6687 RepID=UPI0018A7DE99|nr:protein ALP1-like [Penaeus monodon]